jgi:hypothetical protein
VPSSQHFTLWPALVKAASKNPRIAASSSAKTMFAMCCYFLPYKVVMNLYGFTIANKRAINQRFYLGSPQCRIAAVAVIMCMKNALALRF